MLPSMMRSQSFTRLRYPTIMDHGVAVPDEDAILGPDELLVYGSLQPGTGATDLLNRSGAEIAYTLLADLSSDVQHQDRFVIGGREYWVNGEPERWETGIMDHQVIRLSRWVG